MSVQGGVRTVQLRRYAVDPARLDAFVDGWSSQIPALRERYGFRVDFAYLDRDNAAFVWAVSVAGDRAAFDAADAAYYGSPEKRAQGEPPVGDGHLLRGITTGIVTDVLPGR